jgi:hypothetical protein
MPSLKSALPVPLQEIDCHPEYEGMVTGLGPTLLVAVGHPVWRCGKLVVEELREQWGWEWDVVIGGGSEEKVVTWQWHDPGHAISAAYPQYC